MTKRALFIAGIIGLVAAVAAALLINQAPFVVAIDFVALVLNVIAAGIAGRLILGRARVHRYFLLGTVLLSAIAGWILTSATTSYLISQVALFGPVSPTPTGTAITSGIIGLVVYLAAATVYGFAGKRQGVRLGGRIGLLLLLLAAVLPVVNVLGLIGLTITVLLRTGPESETPATPEPPAASA